MPGGSSEGDHPAHGESCQVRPPKPQGVDHLEQLCHEVPDGAISRRIEGPAVSQHVEADDLSIGRQGVDDAVPHREVEADAVEQDQRRALSPALDPEMRVDTHPRIAPLLSMAARWKSTASRADGWGRSTVRPSRPGDGP